MGKGLANREGKRSMGEFNRYKVTFEGDEGAGTEVYVVASTEDKAVGVARQKRPDISEAAASKVEPVDRIPPGPNEGQHGSARNAQSAGHYQQGRAIASVMIGLGWLGVALSLVLALVSLGVNSPSAAYAVTSFSAVVTNAVACLFLVGIGHVMKAVFDIADNSFT